MLFNISIIDYIINPFTVVLPVLVATAFFTLAERKVLASVQRRVGPMNVGFLGVLQPIADGLKLLTKSYIIPANSNKLIWQFVPYFSLWFSFIGWYVINSNFYYIYSSLNYSLIFLFIISSLNVYWIFLAGWFGRSQYGVLGAVRSISQLISYELVISMSLVPVALLSGSLNLNYIVNSQIMSCWFIFPLLPAAILYFICLLAETNRIPFDLLEAEAELVAGYYTEYGGFWFASFFLSEYGNMLLLSSLFSSLFLGGGDSPLRNLLPLLFIDLIFYFKTMTLIFIIIFLRANLPRFRFDQLMFIGWKVFIPVSLSFIFFYVGLSLFLSITYESQLPFVGSVYNTVFTLSN